MVLMHDGLIGSYPQDFIFKLVIFVVAFLVVSAERFAIKTLKGFDLLQSVSIYLSTYKVIWSLLFCCLTACLWYPTNSVCDRFGSYASSPAALSFWFARQFTSNLFGGLGLGCWQVATWR